MASVARRHFRRTTVPPSAFYNLNETILSLQTNEVLESWILTEAVSCRQVAKQRTTRACIMRFSHNICPGPFPDQICWITRRAVSSLWDNILSKESSSAGSSPLTFWCNLTRVVTCQIAILHLHPFVKPTTSLCKQCVPHLDLPSAT